MYRVNEHLPNREDVDLFGRSSQGFIKGELMVLDQPKKIEGVGKVKQVSCGLDHVVFLDETGQLYAMGDDTFGQCGTGGEGRSMTAPFFESRQGKPVKIELQRDSKGKVQPVKKVVSGFRHNLAITENGKIYGWGYNNQ